MSHVDEPQHEPRPVDSIWPDRREALATQHCSIGHHVVTDDEIAAWNPIDRSEYFISGCCPTCWEKLFPNDDED